MKLYIITDLNNRIVHCGTTPIGEESIEIEMNDRDSMFEVMDNMSSFIFENNMIVKDFSAELENCKIRKDEELNDACSKSTAHGFTHVIGGKTYLFNFSVEAQGDFLGIDNMLTKGKIAKIPWTVQDQDGNYVRVDITKTIMDELAMASLMHKSKNISKYRDVLLPLVKNAKTIEEVEVVNW